MRVRISMLPMKKVETTQNIVFTCDYSGETFEGSELPPTWYEIEVLDDIGIFFFQAPQDVPAHGTRHLAGRNTYHFSSLANARAWLTDKVDETLREMKPPADRKNVSFL